MVDLTRPTVLANLSINTDDAPATRSAYGVYALNAGAARLIHLNVRPGQGGPGLKGLDGRDGPSGDDGQDGYPGGKPISCFQAAVGAPVGPDAGFRGKERVSMCHPHHPNTTASGAGGYGAVVRCARPLSPAEPIAPTSGADSARALGGAQETQPMIQTAKDGQDAPNNYPSTRHGSAGDSTKLPQIEQTWQAPREMYGQAGQHGLHGSGGSGGGGTLGRRLTDGTIINGRGGAAGGAGGCDGEAGQGGAPGGGSFGLFALSSESLTMTRSSFVSASGGAGGDGGRGGIEGKGGKGGKGADKECAWRQVVPPPGFTAIAGQGEFYDCITANSKAGDGGRGSDGQRGGAGGGGAGGPSFGGFCVGTTLNVDPSVTFRAHPSAAPGGRGGDGQPNHGADGLRRDQLQCVAQ